jgi:hypothetical protein
MKRTLSFAALCAAASFAGGAESPATSSGEVRQALFRQAGAEPAPASEAALAVRIAAMRADHVRASITSGSDGLAIDGHRYQDREGQIADYGYDNDTGDVTYAVRSGARLVYKYVNAGSAAEPVTLATAHPSGAGWQVATVTGKTYAAQTITPSARGC